MDEFYRIPLSTAEATTTLAVLRAVHTLLIQTNAAPDIAPEVLESAAARIEAEIPEFLHGSVEHLCALLQENLVDTNFSTASDDYTGGNTLPPFPTNRTRRLLQQAERSSGVVEIEYYVARRNEWTVRRVEIGELQEKENGWYLAGQCRLRNDYRHFRLDHIRAVRLLDESDDGKTGTDEDEDALPDPFSVEGKA